VRVYIPAYRLVRYSISAICQGVVQTFLFRHTPHTHILFLDFVNGDREKSYSGITARCITLLHAVVKWKVIPTKSYSGIPRACVRRKNGGRH